MRFVLNGGFVNLKHHVPHVHTHGAGAYRKVPPIGKRSDCCINVIPAAVLSQVLDVATERQPRFQCVPHSVKGATRHVRMADDVVRSADEVAKLIPRQINKNLVGLGNHTTIVRDREEQLLRLDLMSGSSCFYFIHRLSCLNMPNATTALLGTPPGTGVVMTYRTATHASSPRCAHGKANRQENSRYNIC